MSSVWKEICSASVKQRNVNMNEQASVAQRVSDGKFYRGGYIWRWCRRWRNAAVLPRSAWLENVLPNLRRGVFSSSITLVAINDVSGLDRINRRVLRRHGR
jgi:hypothetical protein